MQRICARCGHLDTYPYDGVGATEIDVRDCKGCEFETRQRPLCDDWDGSWRLPGEDEEPSDPAGNVGVEPDREPRPSTSDSSPSVAGTFSADTVAVDEGPWCPTCEGDLEDEGSIGDTQAWFCASCESLLKDDDALYPGDDWATDDADRDDTEGNHDLTATDAGGDQEPSSAAVATDGGEAAVLGRWAE